MFEFGEIMAKLWAAQLQDKPSFIISQVSNRADFTLFRMR